MPHTAKCWICTLPLVVVVGALIGFAASAAVEQFRIGEMEKRQEAMEKSVAEMHDTVVEMRIVLRTVKSIESKLDKHIETTDRK